MPNSMKIKDNLIQQLIELGYTINEFTLNPTWIYADNKKGTVFELGETLCIKYQNYFVVHHLDYDNSLFCWAIKVFEPRLKEYE